MITRKELLSSKEYWMVKIQNDLFNKVEEYMKENNINRTQLAEQLEVTKGYVSQVLNGDFNGRLSKLVELALAINTVPLVEFHNKESYLENEGTGYYNIKPGDFYTVNLKVNSLYPDNFLYEMSTPSRDEKVPGVFLSDRPVVISYEKGSEIS